MASRRFTATQKRLREDVWRWIWLVIVAFATLIAASSAWPTVDEDAYDYYSTPPTSGSAGMLVFWILAGLALEALIVRGMWRRYRSGAHARDRWQVSRGSFIDGVLCGQNFTHGRIGGPSADRMAEGGAQALQASGNLAGLPNGLGAAASTPMAELGLIGLAAGAAVGIGKSVVQAKRDKEATLIARGRARQELLQIRADLDVRHAAERRSRARQWLTQQRQWTTESIARIEAMGYTP